MKLGENVREARLRINMSQEDLAFRAGLDRTYVSGIERGKRNPTVLVLLQLAGVLETEARNLLNGVD